MRDLEKTMMRSLRLQAALLLAGTVAAIPAVAASNSSAGTQGKQTAITDSTKPAVVASNIPVSPQTQQANADNANLPAAQALLQKASTVVRKMDADPNLKNLMTQAKGILVMPDFGHVTFIVNGRWSSGVLMTDNKGQWSDPAFFAIGGGSLGDPAAMQSGPVAVLIMSQAVMDKFKGNGRWSLNSAPGVNVVNYSATTAQTLNGKGVDAIVWTGIAANAANLRVSINNIAFDTEYNHAVYGTMYLPAIFASKTPANSQLADDLRNQLPAPADAPAPMIASAAATAPSPKAAAPTAATAEKTSATALTAPKATATAPQTHPARPG
jgi:SH3 domain-containing YSC84-like protein 1